MLSVFVVKEINQTIKKKSKKTKGRSMDNELLPDRIRQAVARDEHMRPNKQKNAWSKVKRSGKRIALRRPYHDEYLKDLREATI